MLRNLTRRRWLIVLLGVLSAPALVLFGMWLKEARPATKRGGQQPAEPFRIAGNLYYVGANDIAAFLITGPEGHVVLDGGYPTTALMIMESIAKLGFDIKDARAWGRYRKFVARATAKNPVDPFIDPEGYRAYIDTAEAEFRQGRVH